MSIFATYDRFTGVIPGNVVTASSNITDEAIARGDGGARGIQDSLVFISDTGAITGATLLDVDNLRFDGNAISSTNAGGDIELTPNGAGKIVIASLSGILSSNGVTGVSARTLQPPAAGITISNADGTAGDPTLVLADDLAGLEGLGTTGFATRTAASTWATRTFTAGVGITITNGDGIAGNPVIDVTGGGFQWTEVVGTSQAMAVNNGYIASNAGLVTLTLPATAVVGDSIQVAGKGAGGWKIAQNAGQTIHFISSDTTTGAGGSLASTVRYDCVELLCITINTDFVVTDEVGNITVV